MQVDSGRPYAPHLFKKVYEEYLSIVIPRRESWRFRGYPRGDCGTELDRVDLRRETHESLLDRPIPRFSAGSDRDHPDNRQDYGQYDEHHCHSSQ